MLGSRTPLLKDDASLLVKDPFFFSLVLSLVSLVQRWPRAEALHLALQTRSPGEKWLHRHLSSFRIHLRYNLLFCGFFAVFLYSHNTPWRPVIHCHSKIIFFPICLSHDMISSWKADDFLCSSLSSTSSTVLVWHAGCPLWMRVELGSIELHWTNSWGAFRSSSVVLKVFLRSSCGLMKFFPEDLWSENYFPHNIRTLLVFSTELMFALVVHKQLSEKLLAP